jgi:hypothetical protein
MSRQTNNGKEENTMKRMLSAMAVLAVVLGAGSTLFADQQNSAVAKVFVTVNPNVAVSPTLTIWDLGSIQTGNFTASIIWRVDANAEFVNMQIAASSLYKGDDPTNTDVAPIVVRVATPARVQPANGNEANSGDNLLSWDGAGPVVNGYPTTNTEIGRFESSQNGHFSQNVTTTITYSQTDPEKPQGQYSGVVRLLVLI